MLKYDFNNYCSGCGVCGDACPVGAIGYDKDKLGFVYPHIDIRKCTNCGLCEKVCPHMNAQNYREEKEQDVWLFCSSDNEAKMRSASGGAFYELAKATLEDGGYVCGCVWNDSLIARHIVSNSLEDVCRMQGSKYVQSDVRGCYKKILELLKAGKKVLFSGTPCQAVAMHSFVTEQYNEKYRAQLLIVGVLCHGVSGPEVWESCKRWMEKKKGSKLIGVNFRDKSQEGYKKSYCHYTYANGESIYLPTYLPSSKYIEATLVYNLAIRNSCNHCDCKGVNCACDLIIGDWYAECTGEGVLGTSCIVAFTNRGADMVKTHLTGLREFTYEVILRENSFIEKSVSRSFKREEFENSFDDTVWDNIEKFYPKKYRIKKLFVRLGVFDIIKKIIG